MTRFIFLEFVDPKIRAFLTELRDALRGHKKRAPVHITVRGPYIEKPDPTLMEELQEELSGLGVYLGGAGTFKTDGGYVVFLKAQSPIFDHIWWKPDYPQTMYAKNPHLTLYETSSSQAASAVERFLRRERIEIHTFGIELRVRTRKQSDLFDIDLDSRKNRLPDFLERLRVKPGILDRARALADGLPQ